MTLREIFFSRVQTPGWSEQKTFFCYLSDLINQKNVSIKALKFAHIVEKCKRDILKALKSSQARKQMRRDSKAKGITISSDKIYFHLKLGWQM